jgi:sulfite reductase (ferredoxin)
MSFSSDKDTALSYLHDLGFIPKKWWAWFKVMLGGGLGSQPHHAELLSEFIPVNQIIPTRRGFENIWSLWRKSQTFKSTYEILIKDIGRDEF